MKKHLLNLNKKRNTKTQKNKRGELFSSHNFKRTEFFSSQGPIYSIKLPQSQQDYIKDEKLKNAQLENLKAKTLALKNDNDTLIILNPNILKAINFAREYPNVESDKILPLIEEIDDEPKENKQEIIIENNNEDENDNILENNNEDEDDNILEKSFEQANESELERLKAFNKILVTQSSIYKKYSHIIHNAALSMKLIKGTKITSYVKKNKFIRETLDNNYIKDVITTAPKDKIDSIEKFFEYIYAKPSYC